MTGTTDNRVMDVNGWKITANIIHVDAKDQSNVFWYSVDDHTKAVFSYYSREVNILIFDTAVYV